MENYLFPSQAKEQNNMDINFDNKIIDNIFCPKCLKFPEYVIRLSSTSNISLVHTCLEGKMAEKSFTLKQKYIPLIVKCHYCMNNSTRICIKCKYTMCEECFIGHNKQNLLQTIQIPSIDGEKVIVFKDIINCQYFCDEHLLKYEYYCPVCKINLCELCNEEHIHINCRKLFEQYIKLDNIIEPTNDCLKILFYLANIFYSCYTKSFINSKMTLNILLNSILAKNIISFVQREQFPSKEIEIKNDYLNNINISSYICQEYDNDEFNKYYFNLISNASDGNISQYYKLKEIRNYYKSDKFPKLFRKINFRNVIKLKIENAISSFFLIEAKFNINDLYLILSKCLKKIDELKLKNELNEYSIKLLKIFSIQMNYKLDFELRRKIGNILGKEILKKFSNNLNTIKPTKYLYTLSNEIIAEKLSKAMNEKTNSKNYNIKKVNNLKAKYELSLNKLIDKAREEFNNFDVESSKSNSNVITFKIKNNSQEEIKNVIICNLFFYIKKKFGEQFNESIHNKTHLINSLTVNTLKNIEFKEEEEKNMENKNKNKSKYLKKTDRMEENNQKDKDDENQIITVNINKTCPNNFITFKKFNSVLKVQEPKISSELIYNYSLEQDESIINSNLNEFAKMLQEIKSSYSISFNISLLDSLNLYFEGKKTAIIEKKFSSTNLKKIITECSEKASEDNRLIEIIDFYEKFKKSLEAQLNYLFGYINNTAQNLEEIARYLDINTLLNEYKISQTLNPIEEINKIQLTEFNRPEEKYCLILLYSFFYAISNIKALNKIKNMFEKINMKEIAKINIIKENMISKYIKGTDILDENILPDVWSDVKICKNFVDDKIMNNLIVNYVDKNNAEDYKNDLFNLLKPIVKSINLNSRDPQNIILDSFMIQNALSDKIIQNK